jgi:hypothetical protein
MLVDADIDAAEQIVNLVPKRAKVSADIGSEERTRDRDSVAYTFLSASSRGPQRLSSGSTACQ